MLDACVGFVLDLCVEFNEKTINSMKTYQKLNEINEKPARHNPPASKLIIIIIPESWKIANPSWLENQLQMVLQTNFEP